MHGEPAGGCHGEGVARAPVQSRGVVPRCTGDVRVELDAAGKLVWEIAGVGMAFSAERLPGGGHEVGVGVAVAGRDERDRGDGRGDRERLARGARRGGRR